MTSTLRSRNALFPLCLLAIAFAPSILSAQTEPFVAPPRTIADIAALLDQEKPDASAIAKLKADADKAPAGIAGGKALAQFYYARGNARLVLGRLNEALDDGHKALEIGGNIDIFHLSRFRQFLFIQYRVTGNPTKALEQMRALESEANRQGRKGALFGTYMAISEAMIQRGDLGQAETYLRRNLALLDEARSSPAPGWRTTFPRYRNYWESFVENARAQLFEARGQFREAEASYRRAETLQRAAIKDVPTWEYPPPVAQLTAGADNLALGVARAKARQGRLIEAEVDTRRVLLSRLKEQGKYHPRTANVLMRLADTLVEQGRVAEAEKLVRTSLDIQRTIGVGDDSESSARILSQLANVVGLQRRPQETAQIYAELDKAIASWEPRRRELLQLNGPRIYSLYFAGQIDAGISAAQGWLARAVSQFGEKHFNTAVARGTLAVGLAKGGRDAEAIKEFRAAIPVLITGSREGGDDDDATLTGARTLRLQRIVEGYIALLARVGSSETVAVETFGMADAIRSQSVRQALSASSARVIAKDRALAELVRKQQDLAQAMNGQLVLLNNVLSLPPSERDAKSIQDINGQIDRLRADRDKARAEIARRFPSYSDLIDPKPPTVEEIKKGLKPGEALLSFYFGRDASFVWAVSQQGPVAFSLVPASAGDVADRIRKLRAALEKPVTSQTRIPEFDVALAYELYGLLLKPVEAGWKSAKDLIVVTNGALGELPLGLLPTAPARIDAAAEPRFAGYRDVAWLARSHAVTTVPSASALLTLRRLPPGPSGRDKLIAFGDPFFNEQQVADAGAKPDDTIAAADRLRAAPLARRAAPETENADSADLAMLPRLPDTADELRSIALALEADPAKALYLGKGANERNVKTVELDRFRVVAFATHGLLPGDLNGLTQPALALTAPSIAGVDGDGVLTMGEILGLKLDADWVVLSACNTGAGAGAGAEAASGLGRAFFYAGTRALLVTNWSVHSASARDLVTDLFRRQRKDARITRAEALRQAAMALMDGPGLTDESGKTVFSYAHPLFWAPYTIIGDGGGGS
jgi:CHAT domain-containing protein